MPRHLIGPNTNPISTPNLVHALKMTKNTDTMSDAFLTMVWVIYDHPELVIVETITHTPFLNVLVSRVD